jgi:hypothetical protein
MDDKEKEKNKSAIAHKALFGCCWIYLNPYVLEWIGGGI